MQFSIEDHLRQTVTVHLRYTVSSQKRFSGIGPHLAQSLQDICVWGFCRNLA